MGASYYGNLGWLNSDPSSLRDVPRYVIDELLIGSPALEVSVRSEGFINRFNLKDSDDAETLFEELTEGLRVLTSSNRRYATNADEVESLLNSNGLMNGKFWTRGEFVVYTIPNDTKQQVKTLVSKLSENNVGLKNQKQKLIQDKFQCLDALFRHIRNSLAHGSFQMMEVQGAKVMIFQDGNQSSSFRQISSRMVISEDRLSKWRTLFRRLEIEGI